MMAKSCSAHAALSYPRRARRARTLSKSCRRVVEHLPRELRIRSTLVKFRPILTKVGLFGPNFVNMWPKLGQPWSNLVDTWPNLAPIDLDLAEFGQTCDGPLCHPNHFSRRGRSVRSGNAGGSAAIEIVPIFIESESCGASSGASSVVGPTLGVRALFSNIRWSTPAESRVPSPLERTPSSTALPARWCDRRWRYAP